MEQVGLDGGRTADGLHGLDQCSTSHRSNRPSFVLSPTTTGTTYDGVNRWTANSCCFRNVPMAQADINAAVDGPQVDRTLGFKQWNVTSIVQGWFNNPATNFGLLLNSDPSKTADHWRYFASNRYSDPNARPYLSVTYTAPGPSQLLLNEGFTDTTAAYYQSNGWYDGISHIETSPDSDGYKFLIDATLQRNVMYVH